MFSFGYKFRPWHELKVLADGTSIRRYIVDTAREYGVDRWIRFGLKIPAGVVVERLQCLSVTALKEQSGETVTLTARFLIPCTGYYNYDHGYLPDFPGLRAVQGYSCASAALARGLDYDGKRVVVIGSGATAVTILPAMAGGGPLTMLQRSPSYICSVPSKDPIARPAPDPAGRLAYEITRRMHIGVWRTM